MVQEEFRRNTREGSSSKIDDEENCALDGKGKKGKGKKSFSKYETGKEGKKKDMSKVKCFNCHDHGNYATNCPQNKKNTKKALRAITGEACMVSTVMGSMLYLDSRASFHISGNKELYISLEEKDIQMHIEMGDDGRYNATGIGTVTFQR